LSRFPGSHEAARLSIFALGVMPIFSVLFLAEIAKMAFPALARLAQSGGGGASQLRRVIQIAALVLAAAQGLGIAHALEAVPDLVDQPGLAYEVEIVATFVAATAFLSWLGDQITDRGCGDGFWILLAASSVARLPYFSVLTFELERQGVLGSAPVPLAICFAVAASALVVVLAKARLPEESPPLFFAGGGQQDRAARIDVWPPLLAEYVPGLVGGALAIILGVPINMSLLTFGEPLHILLTAALIAGFWLLRGWAPYGAAAMRQPVWLTALAQIGVCCCGEWLTRILGVPFAIDGAWLIVVVAAVLSAMNGGRTPERDSASGLASRHG
jgi:preprotein translocase subunit SecY